MAKLQMAELAPLEHAGPLDDRSSSAPTRRRRSARRRIVRRIVLALSVALAALAVAAVAGPYVFIHFIDGNPPAKLSFEPANTKRALAPSTPVTLDGTWKVAAGSKVGYRVRETLMGQDTTAVGRTAAVTGTLRITSRSVHSAVFTVDVTKIKSNMGTRDSIFQRILATQTYPTATFRLTNPITLATIPPDLKVITVPVAGKLMLRGSTNPVTFNLNARRDGSRIEVNGLIPITFGSYGIRNPTDMVASVGNIGELEFLLTFTRT
jgi:polyisoprenoid-binding protein YceI